MGFIGEVKYNSPSALRSLRKLFSRQPSTQSRVIAVTAAVVTVVVILKYCSRGDPIWLCDSAAMDARGLGRYVTKFLYFVSGCPCSTFRAFYRQGAWYGINLSEWILFSELIRHLDAACESNDLRYLLFEGSLIGLYHNAGPLPWDDHVVVVMMEEDALKLIELVDNKKLGEDMWITRCCSENRDVLKLHSMGPGYRTVTGLGTSPGNGRYMVTWPFVDIMIAREDEISGDLTVLGRRHHKSLFQQRSRALFGGISIWAPRDIAGTLVAEYGPAALRMCKTFMFNNRKSALGIIGVNRTGMDLVREIECERLAKVGYLRGGTGGRP